MTARRSGTFLQRYRSKPCVLISSRYADVVAERCCRVFAKRSRTRPGGSQSENLPPKPSQGLKREPRRGNRVSLSTLVGKQVGTAALGCPMATCCGATAPITLPIDVRPCLGRTGKTRDTTEDATFNATATAHFTAETAGALQLLSGRQRPEQHIAHGTFRAWARLRSSGYLFAGKSVEPGCWVVGSTLMSVSWTYHNSLCCWKK
jgi:hypothetical protein